MAQKGSSDARSVLSFSQKEFERRHRKIRELMQLRGIDCLVITGHNGGFGSAGADIRYVSGLPGAILTDGPYIVFPQFGEPTGIASSPFAAAWAAKSTSIPTKAVSFKKGTRLRDYTTDVVARIKELDLEGGTIGIVTMRVMPAYVYAGLQKELPHANLVSAGDILLECRMIKSNEEIAFMRKSGECADKGLEAIVEAARPGITEAELVAICDAAMVRARELHPAWFGCVVRDGRNDLRRDPEKIEQRGYYFYGDYLKLSGLLYATLLSYLLRWKATGLVQEIS
jgi:Xaa-Pro aminopeptidase